MLEYTDDKVDQIKELIEYVEDKRSVIHGISSFSVVLLKQNASSFEPSNNYLYIMIVHNSLLVKTFFTLHHIIECWNTIRFGGLTAGMFLMYPLLLTTLTN